MDKEDFGRLPVSGLESTPSEIKDNILVDSPKKFGEPAFILLRGAFGGDVGPESLDRLPLIHTQEKTK